MVYLYSFSPWVVLGEVTLTDVYMWFNIIYLSMGELLRILGSKTYMVGSFPLSRYFI